MKTIALAFLFLFSFASLTSQTKTPALFRWQDKHARKYIRRFVKQDTLMRTGKALLHISYNNDPSKPYFLLLHGMGANARTNWSSQIKPLSKEFNLILPDLIYFGESTTTNSDYSVEFQVEQIHEALMKLGIPAKINVMGFSYGGLVAAMYNQEHPGEINKLIIIDGPVKFYSGHMADSLATMVGVNGITNVIVPTTIPEFNGMTKAVMSRAFPATRNLKRKLLQYYFAPTKATRDKQMNYLLEHQSKYQSYNFNLDKTPTLLIWGEKDGAVPVSVGRELHKAFPATTQLLLFPKARHDVHFRDYKKVNRSVINFIKSN